MYPASHHNPPAPPLPPSSLRVVFSLLQTTLGLLALFACALPTAAATFEIEGNIKEVRTIQAGSPHLFDSKPIVSIYVVSLRNGKDFSNQYMVVQGETALEGITFADLQPGRYVRIKSRAEPPGMVGKPINEIRASRYGCDNFALHVDTIVTPRNLTATITSVDTFAPGETVLTVRPDFPATTSGSPSTSTAREFKYLVIEGKTTLRNGTFTDLKVAAKIDLAQAGIHVPVPAGKDFGKLHGADLFAPLVSVLEGPQIMTVSGPIPAATAGLALTHEHVLVDFIGAAEAGPHRYDADQVFSAVLPHLTRAHELGACLFIECTPAHLGRDPRLLQRISAASGLHILTNTGLYGARHGKFLPPYVATESAEQLAARWTAEARDGIDGTGIRPGFIKCGVNPDAELSPIDRKLVEAAALAHRATGLPIAVHTSQGPGLAQIEILKAHGVAPSAWIWVHAQQARDADILAAAAQGAWVSFDGLSPETAQRHLDLCLLLREHGHLDRVLLSHDAGWYRPGHFGGGNFRTFEFLFTHFVPSLKEAGFTPAQLDQLLRENPARAFSLGQQLLSPANS
jgi:phosphotriesterase-related protein